MPNPANEGSRLGSRHVGVDHVEVAKPEQSGCGLA
jgi:hypothetical protein